MSAVDGAVDAAVDVFVIGLGVASVDHVTRETERVVQSCNEVLYVDSGVATGAYLKQHCDRVTSLFGQSYREDAARLSAYDRMAARVIDAALDRAPVAFAMFGHPVVGGYAPFLVRDMARVLGLRVRVLPGISAFACVFAELMVDPVAHGLQTYEATDLLLRNRPLLPDVPALIWQIGNLETRLHSERVSRPERFERFRDHLLRLYPADHVVQAIYASPHPLLPTSVHAFPIATLCDQAELLHPGYSLFIPPTQRRPLHDVDLARQVDSVDHLRRMTR